MHHQASLDLRKILAARPVRDSCGAIETPENSRLITGPDAELVIGSEIV
jgi:hypothetical protein